MDFEKASKKYQLKIKQMAPMRWSYEFEKPNSKGELIAIELIKCANPGGNNALPHLWYKKGWIDKELETWWSVYIYCTEPNGMCYGRYNPTCKTIQNKERVGKDKFIISYRNVLNFDWVLEATEENKIKLLDEVCRLAF